MIDIRIRIAYIYIYINSKTKMAVYLSSGGIGDTVKLMK